MLGREAPYDPEVMLQHAARESRGPGPDPPVLARRYDEKAAAGHQLAVWPLLSGDTSMFKALRETSVNIGEKETWRIGFDLSQESHNQVMLGWRSLARIAGSAAGELSYAGERPVSRP